MMLRRSDSFWGLLWVIALAGCPGSLGGGTAGDGPTVVLVDGGGKVKDQGSTPILDHGVSPKLDTGTPP
ncbi:MAG: hypothetical protein KAI47_04230, partial [Deltaproteobacteria bacterium]|nr:hypothetical protein [Deltaproteobacteria bacterium]